MVVRLDLLHGDMDPDTPRRRITLKEAVPTVDEADTEARRLIDSNSDNGVHYFSAPVRFYPDGRNAQVGC